MLTHVGVNKTYTAANYEATHCEKVNDDYAKTTTAISLSSVEFLAIVVNVRNTLSAQKLAPVERPTSAK